MVESIMLVTVEAEPGIGVSARGVDIVRDRFALYNSKQSRAFHRNDKGHNPPLFSYVEAKH